MKKMRSVGPWVWALMWMGAARSGTTGSAAAIAGAASSWAAFSEAARFGTAGAEWLPAAAEVGANAMEGRRARTEAAKSEGEANASRSQAVGARVSGTAEGPEDLGFPKGLRALLGGEPQMRRAANRDAHTLRDLLRCLGATARQVTIHSQFEHPHNLKEINSRHMALSSTINSVLHSSEIPSLLIRNQNIDFGGAPIRGEIHVLVLPPQATGHELFVFCKSLFHSFSTNIHGIFVVIFPRNSKVGIRSIFDMRFSFLQQLGIGRIVQVVLHDQPLIFAADSHELSPKAIYSINGSMQVFCKKWQGKTEKKLIDMYKIGNLSAFNVREIHTEWNVWIDSNGVQHISGPDVKLIEVLEAFGIGKVYRESLFYVEDLLYGNISAFISPQISSVIVCLNSDYCIDWLATSVTTFQSDVALVVRRAPRLPYTLALMLPYDFALWLATAGTLIALVLAWWKVRSWAGPAVSEGVAFAAVDVLEVLLTGGTSRPLHSAAQRLAALSGSLTSLIVGSAYTGLLLSCLTDPHFFREIQTLEDVAASVDRLYVTPGSMYVLSQEHDDEGLQILKDKVRHIPIGHFDERNFSLHDVLRTGRAAVTMADYFYPIFSRNPAYTQDGKRLLHIVPQKIISPNFLFYPVQRNNRFMVVFDRLLLRLLQGGFFNYWRRCEIENMIVTGQHADVESAEISLDPVRLAMEHMSGPFLILGVGSAIAICVFMAEYLTINRKFAIRIFLTIFICCPQRFIEWLLQKIK